MSPNTKRLFIWISTGLIVAAALSLGFGLPLQGFEPDPLAAALQRVEAAGSYRFTSDITQVTVPTGKVTNIGRGSRTDQLHLEGETDLRGQSMQSRVWVQDGSVSDPASGIAVKVENGVTYVQEGFGAWREQEGVTEAFAPGGDFMTFLTALRDPVAHAPEERNGIRYTRYTFRLDGPALARYMREVAEDTLVRRGELAPGMEIQIPTYYLDMTGDGELWLDSQGLPIRQIIRMRFPEQRDEIVQAEIVTNFSGFGFAAGGLAALSGWNGGVLSAALARLVDLAPLLLALFAVGAFCVLLLYERTRVWRCLAMVLIVLMVLNPLLNDLLVGRAARLTAARAASQEQEREEYRQQEDLLARMARPRMNPHADPLKAVPVLSGLTTAASGKPFLPGMRTDPTAAQVDDLTDSDGDGLTDFQEEAAGTDPDYWDTDEDGITDTLEVEGFYSGAEDNKWFMNANDIDSNGDGSADTVEYDFNGDGSPDDTDADGIPDVFDDDNDGDGVPDRVDLAPFAALDTDFTGDNPFRLRLDNLTPAVPTFVDFQIRPTEEKHLWYAFNVLDWPANDHAGHVRDDDGVTFATLPRDPGDPTPGSTDENGDLKLIPMLEIRVPDSGTNLPPQADLKPYNISVSDYTADGSQKVVYVPLSVVTDEKTGARAAFRARMRYLPTGSWPSAHEVRLVWLVQMLNDIPCDHNSPDDAAAGCAADNFIHNQLSMVQSYSDDWQLTGLNIKEDHGAGQLIIYEDPLADSNRIDDAALTTLSAGLDQTFLAGRDLDQNGRDVNLAEIEHRFDRLLNGGVSEEQRWGIPNILRVERHDYATLDQAVMFTAMTETVRILDDNFAAPWISDSNIKPLLLYAQEAESRALGMDVLDNGEGWVTWYGTEMVLDLHPAGQEPAPLVVTANLKWTPYCSPEDANPVWSPCSMETWWETLAKRYPGVLDGDPLNDPQLEAGREMAMNLYASVLMQGISRVVEQALESISPTDEPREDSELKGWFESGAGGVKWVANEVVLARYQPGSTFSFLRWLGEKWTSIKNGAQSALIWANLLEPGGKLSRTATFGIAVGAALLVTAVTYLAVDYFKGGLPGKIALNVFLVGFQVYSDMVAPLLAVKEHIKGLKFLDKLSKLGSLSSEVVENTRAAAKLGAVLAIGISWGFFIAGMMANHVSVFSPEFNQALAETIAQTIYIIMMFMLSATVLGAIIVAIIEVIDAILTAICELGVDELREVPGMGGSCFTLGGAAVKFMAGRLYNYAPMVDTEANDLLVLGAPKMELTRPDDGLVDSNSVSFSMPVTTTVSHKPPNPSDGHLIFLYGWLFYTANNLRSTTFKYSLTTGEQKISAGRNQMTGDWQQVRKFGQWGLFQLYTGRAYTVVDSGAINLAAGVNSSLTPYFNLGYALPAYECWNLGFFFFTIPVCYVRSLAGNSSEPMDKMLFDVFPATLDGFMALSGNPDVQRLAWDEEFPILNDADGDGLRSTSRGGPDPDDGRWDTDGDELSDTYELEQRQEGLGYSPTKCDSDGDGLTDRQEAKFGTAPDQVDTDRDGLLDSEEVVHPVLVDPETLACLPSPLKIEGQLVIEGGWWVQLPGYINIRVGSDPLLFDTDGDGVSDLNERDWALDESLYLDPKGRPYHPRVQNVPWLSVTGNVSRDMVMPGASLTYTTTMVSRTALDSADLSVFRPPALGGGTESYHFTFSEPQTVTQQTPLNVLGDAVTHLATITSTVVGITGTSTLNVSGLASIRIDADPPTSTIDTLADGQYVQGDTSMPVITLMGGSASDNFTGIAQVEVSLNGGAWQPAEGSETWTFPLNAIGVGLSSADGALNVRARATDGAGNLEIPSSGSLVLVDSRPPDFDFTGQPGGIAVPGRAGDGRWTVTLGGLISDPLVGASGDPYGVYPGSGVDPDSLQVRLHSTGRPVEVIGEWQPATLAWQGDHWSIVYKLPAEVADPTGLWVSEMRAADQVGNLRQEKKAPPALYVDGEAPTAGLSAGDLDRRVLAGSGSIGGVISDTLSGVDRLDVSFAPLEQVAPLSDAVLWLSFDEPANTNYWVDRSGGGQDASCEDLIYWDGSVISSCPDTGSPGVIGGGLTYDDLPAQVAVGPDLNFPAGAGFSVQAWFNALDSYRVEIVSKQSAYRLAMDDYGQVYWNLYDATGEDPYAPVASVTSPGWIDDGQWHHLVGNFDPEAGVIRLFIDGDLVGQAPARDDIAYSSGEPLLLASFSSYGTEVDLDEVVVFNHPLSAAEVEALYQAGSRPWVPASLTQHGSDVAETTWSVAVPAGLEGLYQIDLRGWDVLSNNRLIPNAWRGTIDTWAPRLSLTAGSNGAVYIDPATTERRVGVQYVCAAEDAYLDESSFQCPARNLPPPERSFAEGSILHSLFPDLSLRNGLAFAWTQWQPPGVFAPSMRACDIYSNCATQAGEFEVDVMPGRGPAAVVIEPDDQAIIASEGTVDVTVSANALESLKRVTLRLDGTIVDREDFAEADAVVFSQRVNEVAASEGAHTLVASASDWGGQAQDVTFPVHFTLDLHPPSVSITTTEITPDEVYHRGSPMLRFGGTANDTVCLAAVQLRVDAGPLVDANLKDGSWSVAYFVNAPEGKTLTVTARATDCAGRVTEVTKTIGTDLSAPDAPDTRLTSTPNNPSGPDGAIFAFEAITMSEREVAGMLCRLDDELFTPCASPHRYYGLSGGQHTFYVRAVDVDGFVDETPASFTWTVTQLLLLPLIRR